MTNFHKASVLGLINNMISSLLWTGRHWKAWNSVQRNQSPRQEEKHNIPLGNLVLLHDHPEGCNKIQDNFKSKMFVMESKQQDLHVYSIKPLNGKGPMCVIKQWQLFDLISHRGMIYIWSSPWYQTTYYSD